MKIALLFLVAIAVVATSGNILPLAKRDHRIVGGIEAVPHSIPSILNLGQHSCGATLIHPKWAITAAHCVPIYGVVGGDHNIVLSEGNEQRRNVIKNIVHPQYQSPGPYSNDVALLELDTPFNINQFVQVAKLPGFNFVPSGDALVAGWGVTESGSLSKVLLQAVVPLVSKAVCQAAYGSTVDDSMLCAGIAGKDSCQGDSGGPLYCNSDNGLLHCGIVSWGNGCGLPGYPGVYAKTSMFHDFIAQYVPLPTY